MVERLSEEDVARLLGDPGEPHRVRAAGRLGKHLSTGSMTSGERRAAEQVLRGMLQDAVLRVRLTLAETLRDSPYLPRDVALALARDVEEVALPILQSCVVLDDDDLLEIIEAGSPGKQVAIAGRKTVSPKIAEALVGTENERAVARLVANRGAQLSPALLDTVYERYGESDLVVEPLARRPGIPVALAERLVAQTAERLRTFLGRRSDVSDAVITQLVMRTREQATVELRSPTLPAEEAVSLVRQIAAAGRLTPSLILRALCLGDLGFVEAALSELGRVPGHVARRLLHDAGGHGIKGLYDRAGLPAAYFPAFKIGIEVARETKHDGLENDRERYRRRMIERILTQFEALGAEDLDYLLVRLATDAAA